MEEVQAKGKLPLRLACSPLTRLSHLRITSPPAAPKREASRQVKTVNRQGETASRQVENVIRQIETVSRHDETVIRQVEAVSKQEAQERVHPDPMQNKLC